MDVLSSIDELGSDLEEDMPEPPKASSAPQPGWCLQTGTDSVVAQLAEILRRLDDVATGARLEEVIDRMDSNSALLREALRNTKSPRFKGTLDTFETFDTSKSSNNESPNCNQAVVHKQASDQSSLSRVRVKPKKKISMHSAGTGLFTTFTEADLALRARAQAEDSRITRQRYADHELQHSVDQEAPPTRLQDFVRHPAFDGFFAMIVLINCFFIAFEVQESIWNDAPQSVFLTATQYAFSAIFTIELILRFAAFGCSLFCSDEWSWICLDTLIVLTSLVEVVGNVAVAITQDEALANSVLNISGFKAFRIIRVTRILKTLRLVRVFRFVMALRTLVTSIVYTLRSLFWAMALLVEAVSDYVQNNPGVLPFEENEAVTRYFASLPHTMLTLFMSISGGVSWEEVIAPLRIISYLWVFVYVGYISFTYFAVLNVVTGVFCQSAIDSAQNDHANVVQSMLANKEAHVEKIKQLFSRLGADKTGVITYGMFEEGLQSPAVTEYFDTLGLDVWDAWSFFKLLDLDAGGSVEIEEFFKGCLRLRGQARGVDLGKLLHDQRWLIKAQGRFQSYVEVKLREMTEVLDEINTRKGHRQGPGEKLDLPKSNFMRGISPLSADDRIL
ncbi:unnamed protein product [Durusdinium trenchii]|uniref:Ion transport domain-containing protein n=1 Tax=Durusdinium trenchii TaxID=1381693 RepID=A0ABP0SMA5_9DINO